MDKSNILIMVVEDDEFTREPIHTSLEADGYSVVSAGNGKEALALLEKMTPRLLLTDINMPVMNGFELVKAVKQNPKLCDVLIVILSGDSQLAELKSRLNVDLALNKPIAMGAIVHAIGACLEEAQTKADATPAVKSAKAG